MRIPLTLWRILELKKNQWKSQAELEEIQQEKLLKLANHASLNVPYYENLKIRDIDDLSSLPALKRSDFTRNPESFISRTANPNDFIVRKTSGSSGTPMKVLIDSKENLYRNANTYYSFAEAGMRLFDDVVFISHALSLPPRSAFVKYHFLDILETERDMLRQIKKINPNILWSYPSILVLLASRNEKESFNISIPRVFAQAEILSAPARELLKRSFNCEIRDFYASMEFGRIAWECEEGSMHLFSDSMIAEVLDQNGNPIKNGKPGRLVLTQLFKYAMPLIRYEIGDEVSIGTRCKCGRGSHILSSIRGRLNIHLVLPSGNLYPATFVDTLLRNLPNVLEFQIVQKSRNLLLVNVIGAKPMDPDQIAKAVNLAMPESMDIEVAFVNSIKREASGKFTHFISEL